MFVTKFLDFLTQNFRHFICHASNCFFLFHLTDYFTILSQVPPSVSPSRSAMRPSRLNWTAPLLLVVLVMMMLMHLASGLDCLPCFHPDQEPCTDVPEEECIGLGRQLEPPCGCCFVCKNAVGERCMYGGGEWNMHSGEQWNMYGECGDGLACDNGICTYIPEYHF